jgi:hypothetical protein
MQQRGITANGQHTGGKKAKQGQSPARALGKRPAFTELLHDEDAGLTK